MARPQHSRPLIVAKPQPTEMALDPDAIQYYRDAMQSLKDHNVPFLVGGAYAMAEYAGIVRRTKDLDVFALPTDRDRALRALATVSDSTDLAWPHWLAKAHRGEFCVDVIYNSSNGVAVVDREWFTNAASSTVLGVSVKLVPPEEILWQKAFIMDRERYDGSDVAHLLRTQASHLDWRRLLDRFGENWRVLYSHLILFGFIYPNLRLNVPNWVIETLTNRLDDQAYEREPSVEVCRGTLLTRLQYLTDVLEWGYRDARLWPKQLMTILDFARWTGGISEAEAHKKDCA